MSWTRTKETGHGTVAWRASVDGLPYDVVSHADMALSAELSNALDTAIDAYNLLPDPGSETWSTSSGATITTGIADPNGGTDAVTIEDDATGSAENARCDLSAYITGNDVWASVFVKKDAGASNFARIRIDYADGTVGSTFLHLRTGALSTEAGSTFISQSVTNISAAWWFVALQHAGSAGAAATVTLRVYPAAGSSFPTASNTAIGAVTVYGARIADATADPTNADPVSGLSTDLPTRRLRYVGLKSDGFKFPTESTNLPTAAWEPGGAMIRIADVGKRFTYLFTRQPSAVTNLAADWTAGTSITVDDTSAFPSAGKIYIGFQTVDYTSTDATHFLGCSGQQFNSPPMKHYIGEGTRLAYPEVTNWPRSIEGRRVRLYVYGSGDDPQGAGTIVWVGVARSEPKFNGVEWSFRCDSLGGIFDCEMNQDLEEPYGIRGIYYSFDDPFLMTIEEMSTAANGGSVSAMTRVMLCGQYENNETFCAALTAHIQDCLVNHPIDGTFTQTTLRAVPTGESWGFEYTTTGTPLWLRVFGGGETNWLTRFGGLFSSMDGGTPEHRWYGSDGDGVTTVAASTTYSLPIQIGEGQLSPGTVPRASIGYGPNYWAVAHLDLIPAANRLNVAIATNPGLRLYLSDTPLASANVALIEWTPNGLGTHDESITADVTLNTTTNYLDLTISGGWDNAWLRVATAENPPQIRIGRSIATGNLADFVSALQTGSPTYANLGGWPFIHSGSSGGALADIDTTTSNTEIDLAAGSSPLGNGRVYTFFAGGSLREMIANECRLIGVYPCLNSSGQIVFRRMRLPSPAEVTGDTFTASNIVVRDNLLSFERSPDGLYNTVVLLTGYDPVEDEHTNPPIRIRDVNAYSSNPKARTLTIELKSQDPAAPFSYADAVAIAARALAVFGAPYSVLTIEVPLTHFDATLGTVVAITWSKVPDGAGDLGVTARIGMVIGREWNIPKGRGTLTILTTDQRIGGYAPGGKITSISGASGTTGPFTITLSSDYFPTGTEADDFFEAGDKIRIFRWGSTSTVGNFSVALTSVSGNTLTFTAGAAWTHASITWAAGFDVSTAISAEGQKAFAFIAASTGTITWDAADTDPAFTLA